jgi:hypothetical protein
MIVQIEYDDNGEIKSVAGSASIKLPDGSKGMIRRIPRPGHKIAEVEAEDVQHDRDFDGLRRVMESYRVTGHPPKPRLSPR